MFETVSVDEAIQKGRQRVVYPRLALIFIFVGISVYFAINGDSPGLSFFGGVAAAALSSQIYWLITLTKWKIWAYDNVRNVHELQKSAVKEGIISAEGSFWDKMAFKTAVDREKLNALQSKFAIPDVFTDDSQVPGETKVFYSKGKNLFVLILAIISFLVLIYVTIFISIMGLAGIIISLLFGYSEYKNLNNKEPQIILNEEGISASKTPFYSWKDIDSEDVVLITQGRLSSYFLVYNYPNGSAKLSIGELDITHSSLENLLRIYRGRWDKKHD